MAGGAENLQHRMPLLYNSEIRVTHFRVFVERFSLIIGLIYVAIASYMGLQQLESGAAPQGAGFFSHLRRAGRRLRLRVGMSRRRWLYWFLISICLGVASDALFHDKRPEPVEWVKTHFRDRPQASNAEHHD